MSPHLDILAVMPARGGSRRIPRKNVRDLAGKPLLAWTCEQARACRYDLRLVCSTDDPEIAATAREHGAETPFMRPAGLARDDVATHPVEKHAVWWLEEHEGYVPDVLVRLQPTSPLRLPSDISRCIDLAVEHGSCVSVERISDHRYQVAVTSDAGDLVPLYGKDLRSKRSQDVGGLYTWNGAVYAARLEDWREHDGYFGYDTRAHVMDPGRSLDIDTYEDWERAEILIKTRVAA